MLVWRIGGGLGLTGPPLATPLTFALAVNLDMGELTDKNRAGCRCWGVSIIRSIKHIGGGVWATTVEYQILS